MSVGVRYTRKIFFLSAYAWGYASSLALSPGSYSKMEDTPETLHPGEWFCCPDYLYGVDLYNLVYHWEAYGILEGLWKGLSAVMNSEYIFRG